MCLFLLVTLYEDCWEKNNELIIRKSKAQSSYCQAFLKKKKKRLCVFKLLSRFLINSFRENLQLSLKAIVLFSVILITFIVGNNISRFSIQLSHYYAFFYFLYFVFQNNPETFNGQFKKKKIYQYF